MIPETLEELVDPSCTALLVVDIQNDFCTEGGVVSGSGDKHKEFQSMINNIKVVLEIGREVGALIVYIVYISLPNHATDSVEGIHDRLRRHADGDPEKIPTICLEGTWGAQIVDYIKPKEKDVIVKKWRPSGFIYTNLDLILRNHGIRTLVITGVVTEVLLEALSGNTKSPVLPQPDNCVVILINARPPSIAIKAQFTQHVPLNILIKCFIRFGIIPIF